MIITLNLLAGIDGHAAGTLGLGVFAADQLPLDQELPIDLFQRADVDVNQLAGELAGAVQRGDAVAEDSADLVAVAVGGSGDEGKVGQVARQANAAADDDVGLRAGAAQPFAARLCQFLRGP